MLNNSLFAVLTGSYNVHNNKAAVNTGCQFSTPLNIPVIWRVNSVSQTLHCLLGVADVR